MKKVLLFAMGAMMAIPSMAQMEVDMTSYIQNPGFDEDISFNVDGTASKEITSTGRIADSRGLVFEAADGSLYTKCNDGKGENAAGELSWYGFITRIQGWEVTNTTNSPAWVYFGSIPYDVQSGMLAVGDGKPAGDVGCPAKPEEIATADNLGVLMLRAGWTNKCTYKQVVSLPCAQYRLDYWVKATGKLNDGAKNLSQVEYRGIKVPDEDGFNAAEWTKHSIEFTPTSDFTIEFGFQAANTGSGNNPIIWIDGIKLFKIGDADPKEIVKADINSICDSLQARSEQAANNGMDGLSQEIYDYSQDMYEVADNSSLEVTAMEAALKAAKEKLAYYDEAIAAQESLQLLTEELNALVAKYPGYPGREQFVAAIQRIADYESKGTAAQILGAEDEATAAVRDYCLSQTETPADYTIMVKSPWFIKTELEPTLLESGEAIYGMDYTIGSSDATFTSKGWYKSGQKTDGDQRLNFAQGRSCWNAWASSISTIGVAQDLTELPNGYYEVSADLITQDGYVTDQHVYGTTTLGNFNSPALSAGNWNDTNDGAWETLKTERILVTDGKLTIGAMGSGRGTSDASGWFCATNFRLTFVGAAGEDAIKQLLDERVIAAELMADTMHFALDKKALGDTIAVYRASTDYLPAIQAVNAAIEEAAKSEAKWAEYWMEGKTLPVLRDSLQTAEAYGAAKELVQFAYDYAMAWLASDSATYKNIDAEVNLTKNYVNTYVPAYNKAAETLATASGKGKQYLEAVMANQKADLIAEMKTAEVVNQYVEQLTRAMALTDQQTVADNPDATDYTAFIINANLEAETGWTFNKGNGNNNTGVGQWYNNTTTRYMDSYNGGGLTGYIATQLITGLPNGTYTVGAYVRTPAEGAYLLTAVGSDTTYVEIPLYYREAFDEETGLDVQEVASDKYGPIWEEANKKIMEELTDEESDEYQYYYAIWSQNDNQGRGWQHLEIPNVVVTNHQLLIGTAAGSEELKTEKVFAGGWYSVGGWTLTQTAKGDNTGWEGPAADAIATGIDQTVAATVAAEGIYTIGGQRMARLQRGLNIVVRNGKAVKIFVK